MENVPLSTWIKRRVQFLAGPELLWLQGLPTAWQGPLNARLLNHIVGNAISVPHALIGLMNVLGHFTHLDFDTFPHELFHTALDSRLHANPTECGKMWWSMVVYLSQPISIAIIWVIR